MQTGRYQEETTPSKEEQRREWWLSWLKGNESGKRIFLGVLFLLALAVFLHFRDVRLELPKIGGVSSRYIISQTDFKFPDIEATALLKEQSLRDVGMIYKLDEEEIREKRFQLESHLIHNQTWRIDYPRLTFEEIYKGLDALEQYLFKARFTDLRTLEKIKTNSTNHLLELFFSPTTSKTQETLTFWKEFWDKLEKKLLVEGNFHPQVSQFLASYFEKNSWTFERDGDSELSLKSCLEGEIANVYCEVKQGNRILSPGEKLTRRHVSMLQAMKEAIVQKKRLNDPFTMVGSFLLSAMFAIGGCLYLRSFHPLLFSSFKQLITLTIIFFMTISFAKGSEYLMINKFPFLEEAIRYPLFVPFAALLICILVGREVAVFAVCFLSIILSVALAIDQPRFLLLNVISGLAMVFFSKELHRRNEVFIVCGKVWICAFPILLAFNLIEENFENFHLIEDLASSLVFLSATALFVSAVLPLLELLFHVLTDMTLMEYTDPTRALLRRLSVEAPGTYQHSLVVGNLSECAARAIGASALFCRTAALYHDIGKLLNPHYFTENQFGGVNIHQLLTPGESASVILSHVSEGILLARKFRLPQPFIDIIQEHHGTTLSYYFYCKQIEQMGGDVSRVDEEAFRYPGPKPRTRESAIIMIADAVEAASRSLDEVNEVSVTDLVEKIISERVEEKQFDECPLTFEQLEVVKRSLIKTLVATRHVRVKYAERDARGVNATPARSAIGL